MSTSGSGNNSHGDRAQESNKVFEKQESSEKTRNLMQGSVDHNSRQELNQRTRDEQNPEKRLSKKTAGRGTFGECAIADFKLCGKAQETVVELKNGLPEKIQTPNQKWERDGKNPVIWHVQEGNNKFDLQADVRLKGSDLTAKIKYGNGREVTYKNGEASEITHPGGEKWISDPKRPGHWDVTAPDREDPGRTHHTQIKDVKVNTADGAIFWQVNSPDGGSHKREITANNQYRDLRDVSPAPPIEKSDRTPAPAHTKIQEDGRIKAAQPEHSQAREYTRPALEKNDQLPSGLRENGADWLNKNYCAEATKNFWQEMTKVPRENYNCEFAVQAFVKRRTLPESDDIGLGPFKLPGMLHPASMTSGDSVRHVLAECGWQKHNELTLDSAGHKSGEVVLIAGEKGPHAAIVGRVSPDGRILTLEQKPNPTDAPIVTTAEKFQSMYHPKEGSVDFFRADTQPTSNGIQTLDMAARAAKMSAQQMYAPSMSLPARPARNDAGPREAPADQTRTKEIEAGSLLRAAQNAYFVPKKIHAYAAETGERQDKTVHDYNGERLTYAGFQRYIAPERTAGVPGQLSERLHAAQRPDPGIHTYNGQTLQQAGFRSYMNIRRKPGS